MIRAKGFTGFYLRVLR